MGVNDEGTPARTLPRSGCGQGPEKPSFLKRESDRLLQEVRLTSPSLLLKLRCAMVYRRFNDAGAMLPLSAMKKDDPSPRRVLAISCPTCGAAPGEKCQLTSGQPRTEPHRDRRLLAKD